MLPTFSIQPLIENAVKHNTISRAKPLHISIRTEGDRLVVSNPINPKLRPEKGTGIGLTNLSHRWKLLTGHDIEITNNGKIFSVALPFLKSDSSHN
jgi:LytS/YehU family sensor histidine kinase